MTTDVAIQDTALDIVHLSPLICMELAAGLSDVDGVREKYKITDEQWLRLRENVTFKKMMAEAEATFGGDLNADKRIMKKAQVLLEEMLPKLYNIANADEASSGTIIDVTKQLKELAGMGGRNGGPGGAGVGPGFNVQIEIHGTDKSGVVIQGN